MKKLISFLLFISLFSCATKKQPSTLTGSSKADIYYQHGTDNLIQKRYTQALQKLTKAKELSPQNSKIRNNLAMAYYLKGHTKEALQEFQAAINLDPKDSDAKNNLASVYYQQGRYLVAKDLYLKVSQDLLYPNQFRTFYNLALVHEKLFHPKKTLHYLKESLNANPQYCPAHMKMANIYKKRGQYTLASESYHSAYKEKCSDQTLPRLQRARLLLKLGKDAPAIAILRELQVRFPKSLEAQTAKKLMSNLKLFESRDGSINL